MSASERSGGSASGSRRCIPPRQTPPPADTAADGTHPSGMHSCLNYNYHPQMKFWAGNIFTSVCYSFCPQGEGVCIQGGCLHLGVVASGGEGLHPWGICIGYYGIWSTSGQYVSYWNAFLLIHISSHYRSLSRNGCLYRSYTISIFRT